MRTTCNSLIGYWIAGCVLIWLIVPVSLADILIAPQWHAPNSQCDSLGIPIMQTMSLLVPWGMISVLISTVLMFLLVRKRVAGADIFDLHLGVAPWNWIVTLLAGAIIVPIVFAVGTHVWQALIPQTLSSDCAGRAELIVVTMRGPIFQLSPLWEIAVGFWVLHIRALLLSPRVKRQPHPLPVQSEQE